MATYNRAQFIVETLISIQNQTFENWECLIIDDGGIDNTVEVISLILKNDNRFSYQKRTKSYKKGLPGSRNYGLDLANGDYIIFFDDDDIVHPQNLQLCVKELSNKELFFCRYLRTVFTGDFSYNFDLSKEYTSFKMGVDNLEVVIKNELPINSCVIMWKKECFMGNRFVETLMYAEEWELYSRILSEGYKGVSIDKVLFFGRKHKKSNTGEFYQGNLIRVESKIKACKLIVSNLNERGIFTPSMQKYFVWKSFLMKSPSLFRHLNSQANVEKYDRFKNHVLYRFAFAIKIFLLLKKYIKNRLH